MKKKEIIYRSKYADWTTPDDLFEKLDNEFGFTLDAAAADGVQKCDKYFSPQTDALLQEWTGTVWLNPPYGSDIKSWIKKAYRSARENNCTVVILVPSRTDTEWFSIIYDHATFCPRPGVELRFLKGRLVFGGPLAESNIRTRDAAPFPSVLIVIRPPTNEPDGN